MPEKTDVPESSEEHIDALPESLQKIALTLQQKSNLKPREMRKLILAAGVTLDDILPWADFNHSAADCYGRKMVYEGTHFEIMVMSWKPEDFSAIHDHGYTQWGCVQVFGPAEHAIFRYAHGQISTLARWQMKPGEVIGVHHDLIHQMGNNTDHPFLSLHIYGESENQQSITGDARVFDIENTTIQRVDGGVFFELPPYRIKSIAPSLPADFPTRLRYLIELAKRLHKRIMSGETQLENRHRTIINWINSPQQQSTFLEYIRLITDNNGHNSNSTAWKVLRWELKVAASFQRKASPVDYFDQYAELYDAVIGKPCLKEFIHHYLNYVHQNVSPWHTAGNILSLGVGTGLTEEHLIHKFGVSPQRIYGIDISEAMVEVAQQRVAADVGNILELDPEMGMWDTVYSGLNVFHYLPYHQLESAIQKTSSVLHSGGYFIGDFITPDHIRWYPHILVSDDENTISLRQPQLVEEAGIVFQESDIINVQFRSNHFHVHYAGKHRRCLPPLVRIRSYFEKYFSFVEIRDVKTLEIIPEWADSCASTRYFIIARK